MATNHLGGNVMSVTNQASLMLFYKSVGVRHLVVKPATTDTLFNGSYSFPQFTRNLVNSALRLLADPNATDQQRFYRLNQR